VLRQDEVAEFIHSRKGEKYSALLPLFGLHELEIAAENLRQLARTIGQQSKLSEKRVEIRLTTAKRNQIFGDDADDTIQTKLAECHKKYCPKSKVTEDLARCKELETALTSRIDHLSTEKLHYVALRVIADTEIAGAVQAMRDANAKLAGSVEPLIAEKLAVLQSADAFTVQLKDKVEVACPACGQSIPVSDFKMHVKAEQMRLRVIIAIFEDRKTAISTLIDCVKTIKSTLAKAEIKTWCHGLKEGSLKGNLDWVGTHQTEELRRSVSEDDLKSIEDNCLAVIKAANDASQDVPPDIKDISRDKTMVETATAVFNGKLLESEISRLTLLTLFVEAVEAGVRGEIRERSEAVIDEISGDIGAMWKVLHPGEPIENVRLYLPEDDKAIDIALKFHGKDQDSPRLTLSEGYRNSLGLCIFLAMAKCEAANDRPLFLDDVVISLDRHHRGMIVQLLEDDFAKRQVILLTHDRDWYAELRQQLGEKQWEFKTLLPYETPLLGIRWSHKTTTFDDARMHLKDRPDSAGNDARKIMDVELALIAEKLQIKMPFVRGDKNDKRVSYDFLERLMADGQKCFQKKMGDDFSCHAAALEALERASRLLVSWGNKSSHSHDIVRPEADKLIDTCEKALHVFRCDLCKKPLWFTNAENAGWIQCHCGDLRWRYSKG
jgi:hypothetical protein